jgi:fumarate reductase subunit C
MATLRIMFPWLSTVIDQGSAGARVYVRPRQRWWWLRLRVCDVYKVFDVGECVHVFDRIFRTVEFATLSKFKPSGRAANSQILLACNLKVFRIV